MIKRLFSILLPAAFVAAGCSQLEEPVGEQSVTSETSLLTKCVNSAANAQEGTLLVYLDEPLALMLAAGEGTPEWDQACQKLGAEYVEKLFPKTLCL